MLGLRFYENLIHSFGRVRIESSCLSGSGLLKQSLDLEVRSGGNERGSLIGVFCGDITTDSSAFIENEAVVVL